MNIIYILKYSVDYLTNLIKQVYLYNKILNIFAKSIYSIRVSKKIKSINSKYYRNLN